MVSLPEKAYFVTDSRAVAKQEGESLAIMASPSKEDLSPWLFPMQQHNRSRQLLLTAEGVTFLYLLSCSS